MDKNLSKHNHNQVDQIGKLLNQFHHLSRTFTCVILIPHIPSNLCYTSNSSPSSVFNFWPLCVLHIMASSISPYEVLGIPTSANGNEIRAAYRRLARTCHPDVVSINRKEISANQFMKIHAAYSTLSDPDKRADYDRDNLYMRNFPSSALTYATMAAFKQLLHQGFLVMVLVVETGRLISVGS